MSYNKHYILSGSTVQDNSNIIMTFRASYTFDLASLQQKFSSFLREARLTLESHADAEALLEATEGASLPLGFVNATVLVLCARVSLVILNRPLEKTLSW